ncbi:MAG: DNA polymerase domain-containing protein [Desertimonas sp.]
MTTSQVRHGVKLSSLDDQLFAGAGLTKRALIDYLDALHGRMVPVLCDRPLSVVRTTGDTPFMQKNLPRYAPAWIERVTIWAAASRRDVHYALCNDRRTLLWFGNQRAVEYHPTLALASDLAHPTHLVIDVDPPSGGFAAAVRAAHLVRHTLEEAGLPSAVKTSGAKGVHVFVPLTTDTDGLDAAAATRAIAQRAERLAPGLVTTSFLKADRGDKVFLDATRTGAATVAAAYSPRARPGVPVSYPIGWEALDDVEPGELTITTAVGLLDGADPWVDAMPDPQPLPADLVAAGHEIPIPRVAAMHDGKRRRREARGR